MAISVEYRKKIEMIGDILRQRMYHPIGELEYTGFFTYERLTLEQALANERQILSEGLEWGHKSQYGWFFTDVTVPSECEGKCLVFSVKLGECVVFVNGKVYGAFDKEHTHITLSENAVAGDVYHIAMEVCAGQINLDVKNNVMIPEKNVAEIPDGVARKTVENGSYGVFTEEIFALYMDIQTLCSLEEGICDEASFRKAEIHKALKKVCDSLNPELPIDEFIMSAERARSILKPVLDCKNGDTAPTTYVIGNSHLDLEWLWTRQETRRKVARTMGNQLQLIKKYEDYKYLQSQAWILETIKNEYPDLYEDVKRAVKNGSIVVEGGSYVQPDTNLPSGESLVRQFVVGKKFMRDEFGVDSEIFWLPDSFGVSGAIPQILRGCGIKYFMSAKLLWSYNKWETLPHKSFFWQGIDGTEILTNIVNGYAAMPNPKSIINQQKHNTEKETAPISLMPFGHGDGGGGATRLHLEYIKREKNLEGMPKVVMASPSDFFYVLERSELDSRFVGELYFTEHRGTYTSQAKTKKLNRRSEFALRDAELWSALAGVGSKKETDKLWKTVLFHQFHDILPGSAISEVYQTTEKELEHVLDETQTIVEYAHDAVTEKKDGYLTVYNSLGWDRKVFVELPEGYSSVEGGATQTVGERTFAQIDAPAMGHKAYKLGKDKASATESGTQLELENDLIKAEFNAKGELTRVVDKQTGIEFLSGVSNRFRMYEDLPAQFDAWDINSYYENVEVELDGNVCVASEYQGELYSSLVLTKKIHNSEIRQRIVLRKGSRRIDFETEIDWNETHKLLKVDFNTNVHSEELTSEIQYGYVKRPTHRNRNYDEARFEVWQHKWSALCEAKRGFAILNDCKYGISADASRMSLTLLKSATYPALHADKGTHSCTYSVMPFTESLADSGVVEEAYELNCPVMVREGYAEEKTYLRTSARNVIIDTVKEADDGSGDLIVRMYECMGTYTPTMLTLGFEACGAYIADMLERNISETEFQDHTISLNFKAFEIVTLRIKRAGTKVD